MGRLIPNCRRTGDGDALASLTPVASSWRLAARDDRRGMPQARESGDLERRAGAGACRELRTKGEASWDFLSSRSSGNGRDHRWWGEEKQILPLSLVSRRLGILRVDPMPPQRSPHARAPAQFDRTRATRGSSVDTWPLAADSSTIAPLTQNPPPAPRGWSRRHRTFDMTLRNTREGGERREHGRRGTREMRNPKWASDMGDRSTAARCR